MTYEFIHSLYDDKPSLFWPVHDDNWLDDWVHTWYDRIDDGLKTDDRTYPEQVSNLPSYDNFSINKHEGLGRLPGKLEQCGRSVRYWPYTPGVQAPDAYGFYLPFHMSRDYHGIYLIEDACVDLANEIAKLDNGLLGGFYEQIAKVFVYYHEAFHHKVEMLATRLELIVRDPCYIQAVTELYKETKDTNGWQEEIFANIHAYFKTLEYMKKWLKGKNQQRQLAHVLIKLIELMPEGYKHAASLLLKHNQSEKSLKNLKLEFWETIHNRYLPTTQKFSPQTWQFSLFDMPHNKNNGRLNFLIHKRSPLLHRVNLNSRLLSTREFIKRCKQYDEIKFKRSGKGSHQIWTGPSGRTVSIPAAKDLPIGTLKSILAELGIRSSVHEFLKGS